MYAECAVGYSRGVKEEYMVYKGTAKLVAGVRYSLFSLFLTSTPFPPLNDEHGSFLPDDPVNTVKKMCPEKGFFFCERNHV